MTASKKKHCKMKLRVNELQKEAVAGNCSEKTKRSSKFCKIHRKCQKQKKQKQTNKKWWVVNIERESLWGVSIKFSGKVWLNIKSHKTQGFTLSTENFRKSYSYCQILK